MRVVPLSGAWCRECMNLLCCATLWRRGRHPGWRVGGRPGWAFFQEGRYVRMAGRYMGECSALMIFGKVHIGVPMGYCLAQVKVAVI